MYSYIKGDITEIEPIAITIEAYGVGYYIVTPKPYDFKTGETTKVFIYQHVREDANVLYGFKSLSEKQMFMQLLDVKGIGPKSALAVLASARVEEVLKAIESGDAKYLNKFPGIGPKASQQIILDLKGKIHLGPMTLKSANKLSEVEDALRALGYKTKEIERVVKKLDSTKDTSTLIKDALKAMAS